MSLEMREHQHGIVAGDRSSHKVLFDLLSIWNGELQIGTFGVQQIDMKIFTPAVFAYRFHMSFRRVAAAVIGSVALHHSSLYRLNHGT